MIQRLKTPKNCILVLQIGSKNFLVGVPEKHLFCILKTSAHRRTGNSPPRTPLHACHDAHPALTAARGPTHRIRKTQTRKTSRCTVRELHAGCGTRGPQNWIRVAYDGYEIQNKVLRWIRVSRYRHARRYNEAQICKANHKARIAGLPLQNTSQKMHTRDMHMNDVNRTMLTSVGGLLNAFYLVDLTYSARSSAYSALPPTTHVCHPKSLLHAKNRGSAAKFFAFNMFDTTCQHTHTEHDMCVTTQADRQKLPTYTSDNTYASNRQATEAQIHEAQGERSANSSTSARNKIDINKAGKINKKQQTYTTPTHYVSTYTTPAICKTASLTHQHLTKVPHIRPEYNLGVTTHRRAGGLWGGGTAQQ